MLVSPLAFKKYMTTPKKPSAAMDFGKAFDLRLFSPSEFEKEIFVYDEQKRPNPDKDFRDSANRAWREKIVNDMEGKVVLKNEELAQIDAMVNRLIDTGVRDTFFANTRVQTKVQGEIEGVPILGYVDSNSIMLSRATDLKTFGESIDLFPHRAKYKYKYSLQAFIYTSMLKVTDFKFIVVTKEDPYDVAIFDCSPEFLEVGRMQFLKAKERLDMFFRKDNPVNLSKFVIQDVLY